MAAVSGSPVGPPGPPGPPGPAGPAGPPSPPAAERLAYQSLTDLLNSEEAAFWTRNNILVLVQGGLIAAAASIVGSADKVFGAEAQPHAETWLFAALAVLAFVGLATATAWLLTVQRGQRIADTVRHQLSDIEADWQTRGFLSSQVTPSYLAFTRWARQLNNEDSAPPTWRVARNWTNDQRLTRIWTGLGGFFALLWALLLIAFVVAALSAPSRPAAGDSQAARERALAEAAQAAASAAAAAATAAGLAAQAAAATASSADRAAGTAAIAADSAARALARCSAKRSAVSDRKPQGDGRAVSGGSSSCR